MMAATLPTAHYGENCSGVVPIYRPQGEFRGRIFVLHGLGGNWKTTWTASALRGRDVFWPRDLLPGKFPDCEISCVAWPVDLSKNAVVKIAHNIQQFVVDTAPQNRKPIVFIVHSLGPWDMLLNFLWPRDNSVVSTSDGTLTLNTFVNKLEPLLGLVLLGVPHRFQQPPNHYKRADVFPVSSHQVLDEWIEKERLRFGLRRTWFHDKARRPLKVISFYEQPPQGEDYTPLFDRSAIILGTDHEVLISVVKKQPFLAKFPWGTGDRSFRQLCSGIHLMFDHWVNLDRTFEMKIFPLYKLYQTENVAATLSTEQGGLDGCKSMRGQIDSIEPGSWNHFPANNSAWAEWAFKKAWLFYETPESLVPDFPGTVLRARTNFPTSRYVLRRASCIAVDRDLTHFNISLPYLHWDTMVGAKAYTKWLQERHLPGVSHPHPLPAFEHLPGPFDQYHPRRTLDQYYYSRLEDTSRRDSDQVVSKLTENSRGGAKMIMVDQLWLGIWVPSNKEKAIIITSFPDATYDRPWIFRFRKYHELDILHKTLKGIRSRELGPSVVAVAVEILTHALTGMLSPGDEWSLDFLELFREAIGNVTEGHSEVFNVFTASMTSKGPRTEEYHLKLQQEFRLSLQIADIIDELYMLKQLLINQIEALSEAKNQMSSYSLDDLRATIYKIANTIEHDYLAQVKGMIEDAERAQKSILDLLDLQQKQANIDEARSSNQIVLLTVKQTLSSQDQADATQAQSQILFIFTFVTIVFLPLSFFTSYYGMNIEGAGGQPVLFQYGDVWKVMGGSSFPIIVTLLLGGGVWYQWSKNKARKERIVSLAEMKKNDTLPPGLFKEDDPVYLEIQEKVESDREAIK